MNNKKFNKYKNGDNTITQNQIYAKNIILLIYHNKLKQLKKINNESFNLNDEENDQIGGMFNKMTSMFGSNTKEQKQKKKTEITLTNASPNKTNNTVGFYSPPFSSDSIRDIDFNNDIKETTNKNANTNVAKNLTTNVTTKTNKSQAINSDDMQTLNRNIKDASKITTDDAIKYYQFLLLGMGKNGDRSVLMNQSEVISIQDQIKDSVDKLNMKDETIKKLGDELKELFNADRELADILEGTKDIYTSDMINNKDGVHLELIKIQKELYKFQIKLIFNKLEKMNKYMETLYKEYDEQSIDNTSTTTPATTTPVTTSTTTSATTPATTSTTTSANPPVTTTTSTTTSANPPVTTTTSATTTTTTTTTSASDKPDILNVKYDDINLNDKKINDDKFLEKINTITQDSIYDLINYVKINEDDDDIFEIIGKKLSLLIEKSLEANGLPIKEEKYHTKSFEIYGKTAIQHINNIPYLKEIFSYDKITENKDNLTFNDIVTVSSNIMSLAS